jgi:hypothetical protein
MVQSTNSKITEPENLTTESYKSVADRCLKHRKLLWFFVNECHALGKGNIWESKEFIESLDYFIGRTKLVKVVVKDFENRFKQPNKKYCVMLDPREYWGYTPRGDEKQNEIYRLYDCHPNDIFIFMNCIFSSILNKIPNFNKLYSQLEIDMDRRCESDRPYDFVMAMLDVLQINRLSPVVSRYESNDIKTNAVIVAN